MKRFLYTISSLLFIIAILLANPRSVRASEGDDGHQMETEVSGYQVTLASQNDWAKGENTIVVTLADSMGLPVNNADVEILIAPKSDGHAESEMDDAHGSAQQEETMPGMDMGGHGTEASDVPTHDEEEPGSISMLEAHEHGMYVVETHLESSGEHDVHVMFLANGEMLQADFVVEVPGMNSKIIVLWSFVLVNVALVASAGMLKRQSITVKGVQ